MIAAITSCTNTSNPSVMVAAGLLVRKAVEKGLKVPPHVKTGLAPGSRVVTDYFDKADLTKYLEGVGSTRSATAGPRASATAARCRAISKAVKANDLVVAGVLSGNQFEGRLDTRREGNYLASPPLVVAYALAGTTDIDFDKEPIGAGKNGSPVYLRKSGRRTPRCRRWSTRVLPEMFASQYDDVWDKNPKWNAIKTSEGELYDWEESSTYFRSRRSWSISHRRSARSSRSTGPLPGGVGNSVTTPHLAGRLDRQGRARGQVPRFARRRAEGFQ